MSDVRVEFAGEWPPPLSERGFSKRRLGYVLAPVAKPHMFGLAEDVHGRLVRVQVQAVVLGPFGLPYRISPEATAQNGRVLGELAWTALGAEHVRFA